MSRIFSHIGLFAKLTGEGTATTLQQVYDFLIEQNYKVTLEESCAQSLKTANPNTATSETIGSKCDLIMVIGGDGSLLKAARAVVNNKIPVLGINRGNLGFLADVAHHNLENDLAAILDGKYVEEQRTMLNATVMHNNGNPPYLALNDVVLHHGDIARLIEFQIFIDDQFVVDQRADGVIISTPTGSTAYALSGGGPIVYPSLDVLTLMPMFPHALNTRPIVINKNSKIRLIVNATNRTDAKLSCDGQTHVTLSAGDEVHIKANENSLRLLHPVSYNYYAVLREKLGWNNSIL